jgi:hypothetical protein
MARVNLTSTDTASVFTFGPAEPGIGDQEVWVGASLRSIRC